MWRRRATLRVGRTVFPTSPPPRILGIGPAGEECFALPGREDRLEEPVPLSEHEQRLLEQIEQALYAEDPKFASLYRSTDLRSHYRNRVIRAALLFIIGLGLLLAGVVTAIVAMGVAGFVVMLAAASWMVASLQRMSGRNLTVVADPAQPEPPHQPRSRRRWRRALRGRGKAPRRSLLDRLDERFQRRFDR